MKKNDLFAIQDLWSEDIEYIPLMSPDDERIMNKENLPDELPILALRNTVLFPGTVVPITVGREKSIQLVKKFKQSSQLIGVITQRDSDVEDPGFNDLYEVGTAVKILKTLQMPDGNTSVILQGVKRFKLLELVSQEPFLIGRVEEFEDNRPAMTMDDPTMKAIVSSLKEMAGKIISQSSTLPKEASFALKNIESPTFLVNFIASSLIRSTEQKQHLLEMKDFTDKADSIMRVMSTELQLIDLKNKIQSKTRSEIDKQQRDYFLSQQMKAIQEEMNGGNSDDVIADLKEKAKKLKWGKERQAIFEKEINKLQRMSPMNADYSVLLNYLETLIDLPWQVYSKDNLDLTHAREILERDHFGLEKVKDRIIEYLAVLKLKGNMKSPIICLLGPPGVGKTSLGKSVAEALGRKYIRMSLGGLRDEAEIRGHRKTYIGAMPGRIIQNLRKAKTANPVFVLDEIDKIIGMNVNGDPEAALLEVLDPEQNGTFYDNYLETTFDLSHVMFLATANSLTNVHPALRDRMEIIDLSGYLLEEKVEIAKRHLISKQMKEHGVSEDSLVLTDKMLTYIIENYTHEAGVRSLEKAIAKIIRHIALYIVEETPYHKELEKKDIEKILGVPMIPHEKSINNEHAGVVTGLAWTAAGGEILFIEVSLSPGKGVLSLTGNLGNVMKESATIAYEYLKANAKTFGIKNEVFEHWNVHIHVPEGATPKDGPSAGVTILTALTSAFTQRKVKDKLAMTGEITLRGKITLVGGIKEKILAAKRAKITDIALCEDNRKDVEDIEKKYIKGLRFHYFSDMNDLVKFALLDELVENPIDFTIPKKNGKK